MFIVPPEGRTLWTMSIVILGKDTGLYPCLLWGSLITYLYCWCHHTLASKIRPSVKEIQARPEGASKQLQACCKRTEWTLFEEDNIDTYTSTVLFYMKSWMDIITTTRRIRVLPNKKPWVTREVRLLLKARKAALHSGNALQSSMARVNLKKGFKNATAMYWRRIEYHFESSDPRRAWQGLRLITGSD